MTNADRILRIAILYDDVREGMQKTPAAAARLARELDVAIVTLEGFKDDLSDPEPWWLAPVQAPPDLAYEPDVSETDPDTRYHDTERTEP